MKSPEVFWILKIFNSSSKSLCFIRFIKLGQIALRTKAVFIKLVLKIWQSFSMYKCLNYEMLAWNNPIIIVKNLKEAFLNQKVEPNVVFPCAFCNENEKTKREGENSKDI